MLPTKIIVNFGVGGGGGLDQVGLSPSKKNLHSLIFIHKIISDHRSFSKSLYKCSIYIYCKNNEFITCLDVRSSSKTVEIIT